MICLVLAGRSVNLLQNRNINQFLYLTQVNSAVDLSPPVDYTRQQSEPPTRVMSPINHHTTNYVQQLSEPFLKPDLPERSSATYHGSAPCTTMNRSSTNRFTNDMEHVIVIRLRQCYCNIHQIFKKKIWSKLAPSKLLSMTTTTS